MHSEHLTLQTHALDFWLARGAILVTAGLNLLLINKLEFIPGWLASTIQIAMLIPLSIATAWTQNRVRNATSERHWKVIGRVRRWIRVMAILLTVAVSIINFEALFEITRALLSSSASPSGQSLLLDALNIWLTNIVIFTLWFWNLDRGGPALRGLSHSDEVDFLFPQMINAQPDKPAWTPGFIDYFFVSFTNATAFSPTDTLPLTPRVKLLMAVEATASLLTVGLVAARAVNILK
jgi:hypothetical protein